MKASGIGFSSLSVIPGRGRQPASPESSAATDDGFRTAACGGFRNDAPYHNPLAISSFMISFVPA
jgi:hypothetical protein